jgi:gluconolactonase
MPDALRKSAPPTEWQTRQPGGHPRHSHLEGPSFDREGYLYCTDIPFGRVFRISPEGDWEVFLEYDGEPNGLKIHRDGRIFIADYKNGIMVLDPISRKIEPVLQRHRLEHLRAVNDLVFGAGGDLYFTDQGMSGWQDPNGRVFRLRTSGQVDCLIDNVPSPNGLVLDLRENSLFVAVTRANAVWRLPLLEDGGVAKVGTFIQLSGGSGPDGLALDRDGGLIVAHIGLGAVWIFSPRGEPLYRVQSETGSNTCNIAFGGADLSDLYILESETASVLRVKVPTPGKPMFSHAHGGA